MKAFCNAVTLRRMPHLPYSRCLSPFSALTLALAASVFSGSSVQALEQLRYNNPGLTVDLGVGLWAWPIPCDADGDGDFDLMVSCPDKPSNGVYLFENTTGDTALQKKPVFKSGRWMSKTTKYVMPSYLGKEMRVLAPNEEFPDFTKKGIAGAVKLGLKEKLHTPQGKQPKGPKMRHNQWRLVDYDGDGAVDLTVAIEDWSFYGWDDAWDAQGQWQNGPLHGWIYFLKNTASTDKPTYAVPTLLQAAGKPIDVFGCPSPNFEDFDGDGDLDLLCGEFLDKFTYFQNTGTRTTPVYAAGVRPKATNGQELQMDLEMIVPIAFDWDKDGDLDLICGDEDGRVALLENTGRFSADKSPIFEPPFYFQQEADTLKCGALATPVGFDWDADGDVDILSGNTAGYLEFFENLSGAKVAEPKWAGPQRLQAGGKTLRILAGNTSIQGPAEAKWGYTTLNIIDWDGDGLPDIVYNSITSRVEWLRNMGTRSKPILAAPQPVEVEWDGAQLTLAWGWLKPQGKALLTQWRTTPALHDFNGDGLPDLAMLDTEGFLAFFERAKSGDGRLILKAPRRAFLDEAGKPLQLNSGTAGKSGRRKLSVTDWDGDGKFDFLLNSANADFLRQTEQKDGCWIMKNAGTLAEKNIEGHDVSPTTVDFDGDAVPDFLGGAEDGRFYLMRNPRAK